jgi:hypothetical protein
MPGTKLRDFPRRPPSAATCSYATPEAARPWQSVSLLNCGLALDIGTFLMSATSPISAPASSPANSSGLRLEWPMVKNGSFTLRRRHACLRAPPLWAAIWSVLSLLISY